MLNTKGASAGGGLFLWRWRLTFDWIVGILTVVSFWMAGSDKWHGWALALVTQCAWIVYGSVVLRSVPITAMAVIILFVVARNIVVSRRRNDNKIHVGNVRSEQWPYI